MAFTFLVFRSDEAYLINCLDVDLNRIRKWNPANGKTEVAVECHEAILPKVSTMTATKEHVLVGGLGGELIVVPVGQTKARWFCMVSHDTDNIVTHISAVPGTKSCLVSSNDSIVRRYTIDGLRLEQTFRSEWSVNAAVASPTSNLFCVVGDSNDAVLADLTSGKQVGHLKGHLDYSFACAWSPDGRWLVTGNQDHTSRVYDTRFMHSDRDPFMILRSEMAAVRCLDFSSDSKCLAIMEADDFVSLYDVETGFTSRQTIDFFGEAAGIGFSPDAEHFYIGIAGIERGGIFEYRREHSSLFNRFKEMLL